MHVTSTDGGATQNSTRIGLNKCTLDDFPTQTHTELEAIGI
jgi:hypothetical protein